MRIWLVRLGVVTLVSSVLGCAQPGAMLEQATAAEALVTLSGARVRLVAPAGFCLSAQGGPQAVTALVSPCAGGAKLLRSVSVSDRPADLDAVERDARDPARAAEFGFGGDAAAVEIKAARREGAALLLHLRDSQPAALPAPGLRLCRLYFPLRERLALVTVASVEPGAAAPEALERAARAMQAALLDANR